MRDYKPITIKNFLSIDECEKLLEKLLSHLTLKSASVNGMSDNNNVRKSSIAFMGGIKSIDDKLISILNRTVKIKGGAATGLGAYQFTKYDVGEYYDWHTDSDNQNKHRYCSIVIQLNDDYEGGDLEFKNINENETLRFERGAGNLFIFFSDILHRVTPITSGVRYSLVNWVTVEKNQDYKKTLI